MAVPAHVHALPGRGREQGREPGRDGEHGWQAAATAGCHGGTCTPRLRRAGACRTLTPPPFPPAVEQVAEAAAECGWSAAPVRPPVLQHEAELCGALGIGSPMPHQLRHSRHRRVACSTAPQEIRRGRGVRAGHGARCSPLLRVCAAGAQECRQAATPTGKQARRDSGSRPHLAAAVAAGAPAQSRPDCRPGPACGPP